MVYGNPKALLKDKGAMSKRVTSRPTIYDVAEAAGVSHQTVSRFIRGLGVRESSRIRVEKAIEDLGYRRNLAAQALATSQSRRIGALTSELIEIGPVRILQGAAKEAREQGYFLDIIVIDPSDLASVREIVDQINHQDLAGLVVISPTDDVRDVLSQQALSIPHYFSDDIDDSAGGDERSAAASTTFLALEHLSDLGHHSIALVAASPRSIGTRNVVAAYERWAYEHFTVPLPIVYGDWTAASGYRLVNQLPWDQEFTAIVAGNDQMAIGILAGLDSRGIRVPDDISLVGHDGLPEVEFLVPPLTTIEIDFEEGGRAACRTLLAIIEGTPPPKPKLTLQRLVPRASTAPPPKKTCHDH